MKEKNINGQEMLKVLDFCYKQAMFGIPKIKSESVKELSNYYLNKYHNKEKSIDKLIINQINKCTSIGFLSNLGGVITLPVSIPTNIGSVLYIQLRMIASIAYINGFDITKDEVKTLIYLCLVGSSATEILKTVGIEIGKNFTENMLKKLPGKVLIEINKKVGFRLIAKTGTQSTIVLGKVIPIIGGVIGGGIDYYSTKKIAEYAKKKFEK